MAVSVPPYVAPTHGSFMNTSTHHSATWRSRRHGLVCLAAAGLVLSACGSGSDSSPTSSDPRAGATESSPTSEGDPVADSSYDPGAAEFRAVNALGRPVDVYVRSTGLVEAFPIQAGLEPGEVSEFVAPPELRAAASS